MSYKVFRAELLKGEKLMLHSSLLAECGVIAPVPVVTYVRTRTYDTIPVFDKCIMHCTITDSVYQYIFRRLDFFNVGIVSSQSRTTSGFTSWNTRKQCPPQKCR